VKTTLLRSSLVSLFIVASVFGVADMASANDGDLDTTWGSSGVANVPITSDASGEVVRPYGTNKVVVAGLTQSAAAGWDMSYVARFNDDGTLDTTCNGTGYNSHQGPDDFLATDMAVLADGSIVIVGLDLAATPSGVVVKFTPSCQLDMSFGSGGVVSYVERDGVAYQTLVVWNNRLIVGGRTYFSPADGGDSRFTVHRLDATTGAFDTAFGGSGNGRFISDSTHEGSVTDLVVANDGSIVFVGAQFGSNQDTAVAKLMTSGVIDTSFATSGWLIPMGTEDEAGRSIQQRADGRLVVLEFSVNIVSAETTFSLLCLSANGTIDVSCGPSGRRTIIGLAGGSSQFFDLFIDSSERILVAGSADDPTLGFSDFVPVVIRFLATGTYDSAFGVSGIAVLPGVTAHSFSVSHDSSGRILVAGVDYGTVARAWVARLDSTDLPTTTSTTTSTISPQLLPATGSNGSNSWPVIVMGLGLGLLLVRRFALGHSAK